MINIVVGSSLFLMREGIRRIISSHKDMAVTGEATCAEDILRNDWSNDCDVCIIVPPLNYSGNDEFYCRLQLEKPNMRAIIIANNANMEHISSVLKAKVHGILGKDCKKESLPDAIRMVVAGEAYIGKEVSILIANCIKLFLAIDSGLNLSRREIEVLKRLAIGRKVATIAFELGISAKTVSTHKINIMEKLALTSDSGLVQYAMENKMFDLFVDHSNRKRRRVQFN